MALVDASAATCASMPAAPAENEVNALKRCPESYTAVFSQLSGTAKLFEATIAILDALRGDISIRSQAILRTWAARETKEQRNQNIAALQEKKDARQHELMRLQLIAQQQLGTQTRKRGQHGGGVVKCKHQSGCEKNGKDMCGVHGRKSSEGKKLMY